MTIVLPTDNGTHFLSDNCLLVYIDETGDELLGNPEHPVFGFGGIAIKAKDLDSEILKPWLTLKKENFGEEEFPYHITDLVSSITPEQINALNIFFKNGSFGRIGIVATDKTIIDIGKFELLEVLLKGLLKRVEEYLEKLIEFDSMIFIFEDSPLIKKITPYMKDKFLEKIKEEGKEVLFAYESKKNRDPGLELADTVAHTVGRQARSFSKSGVDAKFEPDFDILFRNENSKQSSFLLIRELRMKK